MMDQATAAAFQQSATQFYKLLGDALGQLEAAQRANKLQGVDAGNQLAAVRASLTSLQGPATQQLYAEQITGEQWVTAAASIRQSLLVLAKGMRELIPRTTTMGVVAGSGSPLQQIAEILKPKGPPLALLAAGAVAAFGLAWFLFRENSRAFADPDDSDGHEAPEMEYLPPEPGGHHESYESRRRA